MNIALGPCGRVEQVGIHPDHVGRLFDKWDHLPDWFFSRNIKQESRAIPIAKCPSDLTSNVKKKATQDL